VAQVVEKPYRDLHLFKATPPDISFYSCAWARAYDVDTESAADSILAQALRPINFPEVINAAYKDGSRMFLEMGPGNSCSRMITSILEDSPHMAMSACYAGQDDVATVLRLLGQLLSERVPIDLGTLYSGETLTFESLGTQHPASLIIPVGGKPFRMPKPTRAEPEVRRQRAEDRGQRAEDRGQRAEDRGQRTEGRGQRSEVRGQRTEDRGQRTENRGQRTENRGQMKTGE
jgi:acyl transferase domain-containing protein